MSNSTTNQQPHPEQTDRLKPEYRLIGHSTDIVIKRDDIPHTVLLALEDSTKQTFKTAEYQGLDLLLGDGPHSSKRTTLLVDLMAELVPVIKEIVGTGCDVYVASAMAISEATINAASVVVCSKPLDERTLSVVERAAERHLQGLQTKERDRKNNTFDAREFPEDLVDSSNDAVERTLLNIGGKNIGNAYSLRGANGTTIHTIKGKLSRSTRNTPISKSKKIVIRGRYSGHCVMERHIRIDTDDRGLLKITCDVENLCPQIEKVAVPLLSYVIVEAIETYQNGKLIGMEALSVKIDTEVRQESPQRSFADSP